MELNRFKKNSSKMRNKDIINKTFEKNLFDKQINASLKKNIRFK